MKKLAWALAAAALGAGAAYFLDPRQGPQRRRQWQGQAAGWLHDLQQRAGESTQALGDKVGRLRERLHKPAEAVVRDDGLAPLDMTPEPLEREPAHHHRLLMGLAMATPVAMAVGAAALLRQRSESGEWLH